MRCFVRNDTAERRVSSKFHVMIVEREDYIFDSGFVSIETLFISILQYSSFTLRNFQTVFMFYHIFSKNDSIFETPAETLLRNVFFFETVVETLDGARDETKRPSWTLVQRLWPGLLRSCSDGVRLWYRAIIRFLPKVRLDLLQKYLLNHARKSFFFSELLSHWHGCIDLFCSPGRRIDFRLGWFRHFW